MGADDRDNGIRELDLFQNLRPDQRVDLHFVELFRRQTPGFRNDVFGHGQLADIVKQSRRLQRVEFTSGLIPSSLPISVAVHPDALQMVGCGGVFSFNGKGQSLDRPQMQAGDLFHMVLVFLQPVEVHLVRPVYEIHQRKQYQCRVPDILAGQNYNQPCYGSRCKVVGKGSRSRSDTTFDKWICARSGRLRRL